VRRPPHERASDEQNREPVTSRGVVMGEVGRSADREERLSENAESQTSACTRPEIGPMIIQ